MFGDGPPIGGRRRRRQLCSLELYQWHTSNWLGWQGNLTSTYLRERRVEQMGDATVSLVSALYQCFITTVPLVWHQGLCLCSMSGVDTRAAYLKQVVSKRRMLNRLRALYTRKDWDMRWVNQIPIWDLFFLSLHWDWREVSGKSMLIFDKGLRQAQRISK